MKNRIVITLVCVAGLFRAVAPGSAMAQVPSDSPVAVVAGGDVIVKPTLPDAGLAAVSGFDDEAALTQSVAESVASLEASAAREDLAVSRAATLLAGANLILARQIEPACSRKLLRIEKPGDIAGNGNGSDLRAALDHADELLARIERLLAESAEVSEPSDERGEVARNHKTVRAFAAGLRAYVLPSKDDASPADLRRAVSLLSPLIESEDSSVSAAATLWQASLRQGESDIPRALSVLGLAVRKPVKGAMPYALFASVERCRLLAMRGGEATALALLMQVEERCEDWIAEPEKQRQAMRMVQIAQIQILGDWFDLAGFGGADDASRPVEVVRVEKKWCADRISQIAEEGFDADDKGLFRLSEAIPIIAEPPTSKKEATED